MGKINPIVEDLLEEYVKRKITRQDIIDKTEYGLREVNSLLHRRGIKIWDKRRKLGSIIKEIIRLYSQEKKTRKELQQKFNCSKIQIDQILYKHKIPIWDKERKSINKKHSSKYFSFKEFSNHYFFNCNK
ncbi:MAG: hypothetical protein QXH95_05135 [Thermoplasmata archaeon]